MTFYENTLITKQDLPKSELDKIKEKYNDLINNNSGKVVKIAGCVFRVSFNSFSGPSNIILEILYFSFSSASAKISLTI